MSESSSYLVSVCSRGTPTFERDVAFPRPEVLAQHLGIFDELCGGVASERSMRSRQDHFPPEPLCGLRSPGILAALQVLLDAVEAFEERICIPCVRATRLRGAA